MLRCILNLNKAITWSLALIYDNILTIVLLCLLYNYNKINIDYFILLSYKAT